MKHNLSPTMLTELRVLALLRRERTCANPMVANALIKRGFATQSMVDGRRAYRITEAGRAYLAAL